MVSGTDAFGISTGVTSWVATTTTGNEVSNVTISKNTIGLVQNTGANSAAGILAGPSATGTNQVSNNMVYGVISNSTPGDITAGIFTICGAGATQVYYNTVSMTGDRGAGTTGSSLALAVMGTDPIIDIRNNILINKQTTASTGKSYAIGLGYSTFVNLTSNYNDLFTSGANANFGVTTALNSGTDRTTLALWQTATGKDANSKNLDATFMSATDLHLNVSGNPGLNAAATPIAVTDDIDCDPRDGSAPDIGADEFTGVLITDAGVTAIVLPATFCPGSNLVSATVKNFGSTTITSILIDWSVTPGGAQPQVNPGAISIAPGASQTFPLGNFTFAAATTYSITASTSMPNGGADGVPGNDAFTQNNITTGLTGTYTVGVGMNYATLTAAVADYNTKSLCGAVVFNLTDATYPSETFPITINANAAASAVNTLTIKPASGISPVISGTNATAIIDINNGDYIVIDGSNNGTTSKNLTISNTNTSGSVIRFINDATNNTVKNSILNGVSTSTSNGIVFFSTTTGTTGNDNNTIQNNDIAAGASANAYGIYNSGTTTTTALKNSGIQVIGNNIFNFSNTGIFDAGGSVGTLYRSNQIYEVNTQTTSLVGFRPSATNIEGFIFTRNRIYDLKTTGTGNVYGIHLFDIQGNAALIGEVSNNMIALDAVTPLTMRGIYDQTATGEFYNIYYNSILLSGTVAGVSNSEAYYWSVASTSNVKNNIFTNTRNGGTGKHYSIRFNTTLANVTSDYNNIYPGGGTGNVFGNDGTADRVNLAAWQTATVKDANSISVLPNFTSATDLHLVAATNCGIDGYGTPIGGITTDYDNQSRDATTPDIGADEFTATYSGTLAGVAGSATCENKTVSAAGTTFATSACNLIGKLVPSGASPVSGKVNLCVTLDATQQYFNGGPYVQRHMDIEPATNAATATGTVTLYFTDGEFTSYNTLNPTYPPLPTAAGGGSADPNRANLKITQYHGTPTSTPSAAGLYTGSAVVIIPNIANITYNGSYWSVTFDVNGFSGFYAFTKTGAGPLPISINYFTGNKQGGNHLLNWKVTCNATPKATMTLERSADSRNFAGINTIVADAARCNQPFNYTDAQPLNGMNYYRLKMTDVDGNVSYSGIVALLNAVKGFDIVSIAPNPVVTDNFTLNVTSAQASKMELVIIDMQGRLVNRQTISLIAGFNSLPVNVGNLAAGTYTISGTIGEDKSRIIRFVKQ